MPMAQIMMPDVISRSHLRTWHTCVGSHSMHEVGCWRSMHGALRYGAAQARQHDRVGLAQHKHGSA